jgi:hypothetical protein
MPRLILISTFMLTALALTPDSSAAQIEAQVFFGSAASLPLPISIHQNGETDLNFTAHWDTKPTRPTWYYAWRIGLWKGNRGWRLDHTHHKIYLTNPPAEVQQFRITNGFNIATISRAFRSKNLTYSIGAGPVITYPINTVRNKKLDHDRGWNGYVLGGASVLGMVTREFPITGGLILSLDARGSASYVRVPVIDGHASVPNIALHLHAGLGYRFRGRR